MSTGPGVVSRHGLSFGVHYDPERTAFGALVAHNDDTLAAGVAYGGHEHADVEILAWVVDGAIVHTGPDGREDTVGPGTLQYLAAGTGWRHDERAADAGPAHVLQTWITPALDDPPAGEPELRYVPVDLVGGPVAVAGGPDAPVPLRRTGVTLSIGRLSPGERWELPDGRWRHVHVARGRLVAPSTVEAGDTLEITAEGTVTLVAGDPGADARNDDSGVVEVLVVATL